MKNGGFSEDRKPCPFLNEKLKMKNDEWGL